MADVGENALFTDAATALSLGTRHLLVRDYSMAVTVLAQACELLANKHGDTADELGEPYLLYGRALLGLAREEAGVLGDGVPGSEEAEEDDDGDDDDAEDEKLSTVDEKEEDEEEGMTEESTTNGDTVEKEKTVDATDDEKEKEANSKEKANNSTDSMKSTAAEKVEESETVESKKDERNAETNDTDDDKAAEADSHKKETSDLKQKEDAAMSSSKESSIANGGASCSTEQNGDVENGDSEDIAKEDEEDDVNNLQIAWEVLELAKLVLLKRGPTGWKLLADSYRLLGEVAMEGGNHQGALNDLQGCLDLLQKIQPREPRAIAEIHYQLGLAHSLGNDFDASIEQFNEATTLLECRIKELEEMTEPPKTDNPFYTVEGEIQELKDLLPEIQEKITDMKDFKQEACKLVIEGIKNKVAGECSNGAGTSSDSSSSSASAKVQKPASDISHLVRKKRKAEEAEADVASSPCKKPTPEKAV